MAHLINLQSQKTYATRENAIKSVEKMYGPNEDHFGSAELHYLIAQTDEGRFLPVFIGERAIKAGVHFNFSIAA